MGWAVWGIAAGSVTANGVAHAIVRGRALEHAIGTDTARLTQHQMRVLMNRGDWRDPIERHHDSMTAITQTVSLVVAAAALWFFGGVAA
jgi:hypothetical protein